jgi:hypothetical protein
VADDNFGICSDSGPIATTAPDALRRWLARQLRQPTPEREHLEAAVAGNDPDEVRRLLARVEFSPAQMRYAEDLLQRWEEG